jgi:hypothetical protein
MIDNNKLTTLDTTVRQAVASGSNLYSDALGSYRELNDEYIHKVIDLENFWSLLKRAIHGTYISVEPFHLFRYLDEQAFRFNNHDASDRQRFVKVAGSVMGKRLTYAELTGNGAIA